MSLRIQAATAMAALIFSCPFAVAQTYTPVPSRAPIITGVGKVTNPPVRPPASDVVQQVDSPPHVPSVDEPAQTTRAESILEARPPFIAESRSWDSLEPLRDSHVHEEVVDVESDIQLAGFEELTVQSPEEAVEEISDRNEISAIRFDHVDEWQTTPERSAIHWNAMNQPVRDDARIVPFVPADLIYRRPYFEEILLERHGLSRGPLFQPVWSTARFFATASVIPAVQIAKPPTRIIDHRAYGRPGSSIYYSD